MRTRARRRFHTERVERNRQRYYQKHAPGWWGDKTLPDGKLKDRNAYFGCGNPHCLLCHWEKFMEARRAKEKRFWKREVEEG